MISKCVNWMQRWSRACVCAAQLIGLPFARHFHNLIAWKGKRGDCRSLAMWAKRMDLECISIGSKAPAVGGCPRPLDPSWKCRWAVPPPALAAPSLVLLYYHTCLTERPLQLSGAHTWSGSESFSYLDVYREQRFATRPARAGPHCYTSLNVIGGPAHQISPPKRPP